MTTVVAFDPGGHTGVAKFIDGELRYTVTLTNDLSARGSLTSLFLLLGALLEDLPLDATVVVEGVPVLPHPGRHSTDAIQLVGYIVGTATCRGNTVAIQQPAHRMAYVAEARGLPHKTDHEVSAIAHGLAYLHRKAFLTAPAT